MHGSAAHHDDEVAHAATDKCQPRAVDTLQPRCHTVLKHRHDIRVALGFQTDDGARQGSVWKRPVHPSLHERGRRVFCRREARCHCCTTRCCSGRRGALRHEAGNSARTRRLAELCCRRSHQRVARPHAHAAQHAPVRGHLGAVVSRRQLRRHGDHGRRAHDVAVRRRGAREVDSRGARGGRAHTQPEARQRHRPQQLEVVIDVDARRPRRTQPRGERRRTLDDPGLQSRARQTRDSLSKPHLTG
jgi:hypothetical protein